MAVAAQRRPHRARGRRLVGGLQPDQVPGPLASRGVSDNPGGRWPDAAQVLQRAVGDPPGQLGGGHRRQHRSGLPKRLHPVGRGASTLQLEGDPLQRPFRIHPA
jgi:hypothetical protein